MPTERIDPPVIAGEREMLRGFLDYHRATLAMKCDGLSDEELRRQSMPPSTLSLLGLVRHMAEVERTWFRQVIDGEDIPLVWSPAGDFQAAYDASAASRSAYSGTGPCTSANRLPILSSNRQRLGKHSTAAVNTGPSASFWIRHKSSCTSRPATSSGSTAPLSQRSPVK